MEALRSYLTTAVLASLVSAVCIQLTDERFRKYIKYLAGLCLLSVLALPLFSLVSELGDLKISLDQSTEQSLSTDSAYLDLLGSELSRSVGDRIAKLYGIERSAVYVTLTLDTADLTSIELLSIDVRIAAECDEQAIEQALQAEFACAVDVREENVGETTDR